MSKKIPLQKDMFSEELRDARSAYRKRQDRKRAQPRQAELFSAQETVQIGVNPRPWLKAMAAPTLMLEIQDVRTDEEKERERWQEAEVLIAPMFAGHEVVNGHESTDGGQPKEMTVVETKVVYEAPNLRQIGFRAYARRASIPVRWKGASSSG